LSASGVYTSGEVTNRGSLLFGRQVRDIAPKGEIVEKRLWWIDEIFWNLSDFRQILCERCRD
jgi:hypothetical protein